MLVTVLINVTLCPSRILCAYSIPFAIVLWTVWVFISDISLPWLTLNWCWQLLIIWWGWFAIRVYVEIESVERRFLLCHRTCTVHVSGLLISLASICTKNDLNSSKVYDARPRIFFKLRLVLRIYLFRILLPAIFSNASVYHFLFIEGSWWNRFSTYCTFDCIVDRKEFGYGIWALRRLNTAEYFQSACNC